MNQMGATGSEAFKVDMQAPGSLAESGKVLARPALHRGQDTWTCWI